MESIIISGILHKPPQPLLAPPIFHSHLARNPIFLRHAHPKFRRERRENPVSRVVSSVSSSCNGWEDLEPLDGSGPSSPGVDPLRRFLDSTGTHDSKSAALFCLGFLSALAVSRVRFSTLAILPVSVLVFAAGLFVGVAQGDAVAGSWKRGGGRRRLQNDGKVLDEKQPVINLVRCMNDLDGKMVDLKGGLERVVRENRIDMGEISSHLDVIESVRVEASTAKKSVEDYANGKFSDGAMDSDLVERERKSNQKLSKGRKEMSMVGSDLVQFLGRLFQESLMSAAAKETPKAKESTNREPVEQLNFPEKCKVDGAIHQNDSAGDVEVNAQNLTPMDNVDDIKMESLLEASVVDRKTEKYEVPSKRSRENNGVKVENEDEMPSTAYSVLNGKQSYYVRNDNHDNDHIPFKEGQDDLNRSFNFTSRRRSLEATILLRKNHERDTQTPRINLRESDSPKGRINSKFKETNLCMLSESESSMQSQSTIKIHNRTYLHSDGKKTEKTAAKQANYGNDFSGGRTVEDKFIPDDPQCRPNMASTSTTSDADGFTQKVQEATELLKQAREHLRNEADEEMAEIILYKSAELLSTAVALKPMSLLAVGQLGNTLLLHGELKLKFSREMRTLLSENDLSEIRKEHGWQLNGSSNLSLSKDKIATVLVDVCEECEELLIEAGRNYRMALSIDGSDIRALYNWGLALYFRAELLADVGPEAAFDADKVYLAAIDKFAAMTSRSNAYAPVALFKWGLALQQRSNLLLRDSKEKMKLLKQAKSLYEEVLSADSNNRPAREALMSCLSEIKYSKQF